MAALIGKTATYHYAPTRYLRVDGQFTVCIANGSVRSIIFVVLDIFNSSGFDGFLRRHSCEELYYYV